MTTMQQRLPSRWMSEPKTFTAAEYRQLFGWNVDESGALSLGRGIVAVVVRPIIAGAAALTLAEFGSRGPVLDLGDAIGWAFLADPNEIVLPQNALPAGVAVLHCPHAVPLPMRGIVASQAPRWIQAPNVRSRWLPTLSTVLSAVGTSRPLRPRVTGYPSQSV